MFYGRSCLKNTANIKHQHYPGHGPIRSHLTTTSVRRYESLTTIPRGSRTGFSQQLSGSWTMLHNLDNNPTSATIYSELWVWLHCIFDFALLWSGYLLWMIINLLDYWLRYVYFFYSVAFIGLIAAANKNVIVIFPVHMTMKHSLLLIHMYADKVEMEWAKIRTWIFCFLCFTQKGAICLI